MHAREDVVCCMANSSASVLASAKIFASRPAGSTGHISTEFSFLAPSATLTGMAAIMAQWEMVKSGIFLIILQLAGIHLAATLVFRFYGKINIDRARFENGSKKYFLEA